MSVNSPPQLLVYGVVSNEGGHARPGWGCGGAWGLRLSGDSLAGVGEGVRACPGAGSPARPGFV